MAKDKAITPLSIGHACVDAYQGAVAALVPYFVAERAYTYAAASGIELAASLLSSVAQPLFGLVTDRRAMPWLLPVSTLVGGLGIALSGLGDSYAPTLLFVGIGGVGVAAYHPESARVARVASGGQPYGDGLVPPGRQPRVRPRAAPGGRGRRRRRTGTHPAARRPRPRRVLLTLPVLRGLERRTPAAREASTAPVVPDDVASFVRLALAVVCRSVVFIGLSTFIAFYVRQRTGGGATAGTAALVVA